MLEAVQERAKEIAELKHKLAVADSVIETSVGKLDSGSPLS